MILAATVLDPPQGDKFWQFHFINDSDETVESVTVEQAEYEWGDWSNIERIDAAFGPVPPRASIELLRETDTEVRTSLTLRVRAPSGERRVVAEFGKLYVSRGPRVPIPILDRIGKIATLEVL